jgi:hypothetical protein
MRLALGKAGSAWVEEGEEFGGYVVERSMDEHPRAELRYATRGRDGDPAILLTARRPLADRRERSRFRQLAQARMAIEHPALVPVRTFGERSGLPYMVMECYPPRTFGDLLAEEGRLSPERVVGLLTPVAEAIDLAHSSGLVHQMLDAHSLLVADGDHLLLDAFGVVAVQDEAAWSILQADELHYRPPEELGGEPVEPAGNVYSLAALIVHALTGAPPYGGDRSAVTYAHLADVPPQVSERVPGLGRRIDVILEWGMAKEPAERPKSAGELMREVAKALRVDVPAQDAAAVAATNSAANRARPNGAAGAATNGLANRARLGGAAATARVLGVPRGLRAPADRPRSRALTAFAAAVVVALAAAVGTLAAMQLDPFGGGASGEPAAAESGVWNRLAERRADLRDELAAARTPDEQAAAASRLAVAYTTAADAHGPARLTAPARDAGEAYWELAAAIRADDQRAFDVASAAVNGAERRFSAAAAGPGPGP